MTLDTTQIIAYLWSTLKDTGEHQVYCVVDAARDKRIPDKLKAADEETICLFRGDKAAQLARVAPYLVKLDPDKAFSQWLIKQGWGKSWGIFLTSPEGFIRLENHCRDLFQVYDEQGTPLLFRYYDPRVLRVYLPTCTAQELKLFYGPVRYIVLEDEDPAFLLRYQNHDGTLGIRKV